MTTVIRHHNRPPYGPRVGLSLRAGDWKQQLPRLEVEGESWENSPLPLGEGDPPRRVGEGRSTRAPMRYRICESRH
jgi:hypothetical protein